MISFGRFWPGSFNRPNRLNDPAVPARFVALDEHGFFHETPSLAHDDVIRA